MFLLLTFPFVEVYELIYSGSFMWTLRRFRENRILYMGRVASCKRGLRHEKVSHTTLEKTNRYHLLTLNEKCQI